MPKTYGGLLVELVVVVLRGPTDSEVEQSYALFPQRQPPLFLLFKYHIYLYSGKRKFNCLSSSKEENPIAIKSSGNNGLCRQLKKKIIAREKKRWAPASYAMQKRKMSTRKNIFFGSLAYCHGPVPYPWLPNGIVPIVSNCKGYICHYISRYP